MKRYRVIVWGPSGIGNACIREILRLPNFELAGVLAYSAAKNGRDAGELIGLAPAGVMVTTDKVAALALDADCVLYTAAVPTDFEAMNADVEAILRSGKNVISATSFHYAPFHGEVYVDRITAACKAGGVSLHGTGIDPGFVLERLALTATALCTTVDHLALREAVDVSKVPQSTLLRYGFGQQPEEISDGPLRELFSRWMFVETISFVIQALYGRKPDRIEHSPQYVLTEDAIPLADWTVAPGAVGFIRHCFNGYLDDTIRATIELIWYLKPDQLDYEPRKHVDEWVVQIAGRPTSVKLTLEATSCHGPEPVSEAAMNTPPSYYATAAILLQAVPVVCAADPGIVYATAFTSCTQDFSTLETRRSLVE